MHKRICQDIVKKLAPSKQKKYPQMDLEYIWFCWTIIKYILKQKIGTAYEEHSSSFVVSMKNLKNVC